MLNLSRGGKKKMKSDKKDKINTEVNLLKALELKPVYSRIAKKYGVDYRTVKKAYIGGYEEEKVKRKRKSKLDKYRDEITSKLLINRSSMRCVYNFLVTKYGKDVGCYSNFKHYVSTNKILEDELAEIGGCCSYEKNKGKMAQCDRKEDIKIHDKSGKEYTINIFHLVLKYSRFSYIELTFSKEQHVVFRCLMNAFKAFGGVPKEVLFDNMSTVADVNAKPIRTNQKMLQFAKDFNFIAKRCKPKSPQTKGTNEARNKILDRIRPFDREFDDVIELKTVVKTINFKMNHFICAGTGIAPITLFYKEKECLSPLPDYEEFISYYCDKEVKVSNQQLVYYKGKKYSVDKSYINKNLVIEEISDMLLLYYKGQLIEIHQISENQINYKYKHYIQTSIKQTNNGDFEETARKNLEIMNSITEERKVNIPIDKAIENNFNMIAFLANTIRSNSHFVEFMARKSQQGRKDFLDEIRELFACATDVDAFLNWLEASFTKEDNSMFALLCFNYFEGNEPAFLTEEGYELLFKKHEEEIKFYYTEMEKIDERSKRITQ